jgi:hypothetical protein
MTPKEAVEKIKSMIFGDEEKQMATPAPAEPQKFMEYKLKSGAVVSIDKLEVGGSVTLNGEPAPDGEHEFEDGAKIVTAGGLITEVKQPEVAPVVEVEVDAMKKLPGMFSDMQQGFAAAKTDIIELKQMFHLVETIANTSVQQPTEKVKAFDEMSALEKFRASKNF